MTDGRETFDPFPWLCQELERQQFTLQEVGTPTPDGTARWILCRAGGKSHLIFFAMSAPLDTIYQVTAGMKCSPDYTHIVTVALGKTVTIDWGTLLPFLPKTPREYPAQPACA